MDLKNKNKKTGSFILLDSLVRNGVEYIFGYPGGAILPIYDELYFWEKTKLIKHILVRHEQAAAHAADGYARSTGKIGVCFATSGPGATNLVTGIANAQMDSIPMIIITGQVGRSLIGTDAFQETDIFGITLPLVKHSYVVRNTSVLPEIISEAFFVALNGRPGPVLIDIPKDVGLEEVSFYKPYKTKDLLKKRDFRYDYFLPKQLIKNVLSLIKQSSQALLYVGGGAIRSNSSKIIRKFINKFQIPICYTLMGKGIIDENHQLCLGMLGMHGTAYANFAVSSCDLLIAIGTRFDDRVTGKLDEFANYAQVVHIDIDSAEIGKNRIPQLPLLGDSTKILKQIIRENKKYVELERTHFSYWNKRINRWKKVYPLSIEKNLTKISPQFAIFSIAKYFNNNIITTDVGQHQMWSAQFLNSLPYSWVSSAGLGTMGFGLPSSIGAKFSNLYKNGVCCITGDSSFQMCLQELGTIKQYNLPIKIFIINNKWQGMVRQWQQSFYGQRYSHSSMEESLPDFEKLCQTYGLVYYSCSTNDTLEKTLSDVKKSPVEKSVLINILVNSDENCYPMVAPGKSNSQMIGISRTNQEIKVDRVGFEPT